MQATNPNGQTSPISSITPHITPQNKDLPPLNQGKYAQHSHDKFIKIDTVLERVGLSSTSLYTYMAKGLFPKKIKIGRGSFWSENAVNQWMEDQKTGGDA